jgi:hypothetical protein
MNREIIYDGKLGFGHREIVYPYEGSQFIDGHTILDNGTEKPQRSKLDIIGATIVDKPLTDTTEVTITTTPSSPERRHDLVLPYDYCGYAPSGSAETAAVWTITRLTMSAAGVVTATDILYNVKWSDVLTLIF